MLSGLLLNIRVFSSESYIKEKFMEQKKELSK